VSTLGTDSKERVEETIAALAPEWESGHYVSIWMALEVTAQLHC
jgi:hypothetical protein